MTTKPTDVRPSVPEPESLQVFMGHESVITAFRQWVDGRGWELKLIPRFDGDTDDTYVPTHIIVPKNLDALMRQRAAEYRAQMEADGDAERA